MRRRGPDFLNGNLASTDATLAFLLPACRAYAPVCHPAVVAVLAGILQWLACKNLAMQNAGIASYSMLLARCQ